MNDLIGQLKKTCWSRYPAGWNFCTQSFSL